MKSFQAKALRPKGEARREALLKAAGEVFLDNGYEKASLSEIVLRAGGSKAMVYEQFGDKAGLFKAMMAESCAAILQPLQKVMPKASEHPRVALTRLGSRFMDVLCRPDAIGLQRVALSEGHKHPDIAEAYFATGHDIAYAHLANYLGSISELTLSDQGRYRLATTFFAMIQGDALQRRLAGVKKSVTRREMDAVLELAVDWLLGQLGVTAASASRATKTEGDTRAQRPKR